jgi:hypothetical protein
LRDAPGSPKDQVTGRPFFWFVFFGRAKKMNKKLIGSVEPLRVPVYEKTKH